MHTTLTENLGRPFLTPMLALATAVCLPAAAFTADSYELSESSAEARVFRVQQRMEIKGTLKAPQPEKKLLTLPMTGEAKHVFLERRLSGTGRDAYTLRSVRSYESARTQATIGRSRTDKRLNAKGEPIVLQGTDVGLVPHHTREPLSHGDVELLRMPGDALALHALLPDGKVAVGDEWKPPHWGMVLASGLDAVAKSSVTCQLKSVEGRIARVAVEGKVEGARDGAPATIELSGELTFDLKRTFLASASFRQKEATDAGPVSPALNVEATVSVERQPADKPGPLSADVAGKISLEPKPELLLQRFDANSDVRFFIDRNWRVVYHGDEASILRLLIKGNLVAQVNIKALPDAEPGKHVSEEQFQQDVRKSLGSQLKSIASADVLKRKDDRSDDRFLYRVTAEGARNDVEMRWIYYLCAAPDGRQVSLVFAVEKKLVDELDDRDAAFVFSVTFPDKQKP